MPASVRSLGHLAIAFAISAGSEHVVARRSDGMLVQWGLTTGVMPPTLPAGLSFVAIDAGAGHTVARVSDGSLMAWGANAYGQCTLPATPVGVTCLEAVAGGYSWNTSYSCYCPPQHDDVGYSIVRRSDGVMLNIGTVARGVPFALEPGFLDPGFGLAGTHGEPRLAGFGSLQGDSPIALSLTNALPSSVAALVLGTGLVPTPLFGGVLVPNADVLVGPLVVDSAGSVNWRATWPRGLPTGFFLGMQFWVVDAGAVQGFAASNAIAVSQY